MYGCAKRPQLLEPQHGLPPVAGRYRRRTSRRCAGCRLRRRPARSATRSGVAVGDRYRPRSRCDRTRGRRVAPHQHITVSRQDFQDYQPGAHRFDLITFVASLHHMDLRASLVKARDLLTPTGEIAVVGISANKTVRDWVWSAMCVPAARIGSWLHSETRNVGVVVKDPQEGLDDIRRTVDHLLPGASVRRSLYYRYLPR